MGLIINISDALSNRTDYNILREPINDMLKNRQEAWEQKNPIDLLFHRGTLSTFQQTYTSSIGFSHAFAETSDYAKAPIFNSHEGFSKTYTSRTFQGGFMITQQVLEDQAYDTVKTTANNFMTRWHGDTVEYAMAAISSGFGKPVTFGDAEIGVSRLKLTSADTLTGDINDTTKNPLFSKGHTIVKRDNVTDADFVKTLQSNLFAIKDGSAHGIDCAGGDAGKVAKMADAINQVITTMENYRDDNNKRAGVQGAKKIVAPNDARLISVINAALSLDMLDSTSPNPAYKRATLETTPYLNDLDCCMKDGKAVGFFIVDPAYNAENHGPEFTERVALTLNVEQQKNPYGISYDARQRFDINVASWRGISYLYIGSSAPDFIKCDIVNASGASENKTGFEGTTEITVIPTIAKPVAVTGTINTAATESVMSLRK